MAQPKPFLSLRNVTLRLHSETFFENTNWTILNDQHWAVVGPNGAGKSTLMKALCGDVPVIRGEIRYHFAEPSVPGKGSAHPQSKIAYVTFELQRGMLGLETPFHQARWHASISTGSLSVCDYLSEKYVCPRNPHQVAEQLPDSVGFVAQREKVVQLLDIEMLLERKVMQISNGELRKIRIAHALMREPQLLILDNPFAGLDQAYRERFSEIIDRFMCEDLRVIVVTTRQDEIPTDITHALLIDDRQIILQGSRNEVLYGPAAHRLFSPGVVPAVDQLPAAPLSNSARRVSQTLVQMENLQISYGGTPILRDINWTVRCGEHWALLGPNGSGKSTLLSLILGDNPQAYANRILLFGKRRGAGASIWETKRYIGWVSPELHLYYPKNVRCLDVVCSGFLDSVGLYRRCRPEQQDAAKQWLERVGLLDRAERSLGELSQGEQRLILIVRALVKYPLLVILDEPCQGLDATNRCRVLEVIHAVGCHLDTSIIYVTHRPDELPQVITHVLTLNQGGVHHCGPLMRQ